MCYKNALDNLVVITKLPMCVRWRSHILKAVSFSGQSLETEKVLKNSF